MLSSTIKQTADFIKGVFKDLLVVVSYTQEVKKIAKSVEIYLNVNEKLSIGGR